MGNEESTNQGAREAKATAPTQVEAPASFLGAAGATKPPTTDVKLEDLRVEESVQPRDAGTRAAHVRELADSDPASWDPITVSAFNGETFLIDGFHRVAAARKLGIDRLPAVVVPGLDFETARLAAFEINAHHGLAFALEDRKAYALALKSKYPALSEREIAKRTGINRETVRTVLGKPRAPRGDSASVVGNQPPARKDPFEAAVERLDTIIEKSWGREGGDGDYAAFERDLGIRMAAAVKGYVEGFEEDGRPDAARNLSLWAIAIEQVAADY